MVRMTAEDIQGNAVLTMFMHFLVHYLTHKLDKTEAEIPRIVDLHAASSKPKDQWLSHRVSNRQHNQSLLYFLLSYLEYALLTLMGFWGFGNGVKSQNAEYPTLYKHHGNMYLMKLVCFLLIRGDLYTICLALACVCFSHIFGIAGCLGYFF